MFSSVNVPKSAVSYGFVHGIRLLEVSSMVCLGYCKTQSRIQNASNVNISFMLLTNLFISSLKKMIAAGF